MEDFIGILIEEINELRRVGEMMKKELLLGEQTPEVTLALAYWEQTNRKPMPQ